MSDLENGKKTPVQGHHHAHHQQQQQQQQPASTLKVTASVSFYMVTSITMVMVNKVSRKVTGSPLTRERQLVLNKVDAPLTFLWLQSNKPGKRALIANNHHHHNNNNSHDRRWSALWLCLCRLAQGTLTLQAPHGPKSPVAQAPVFDSSAVRALAPMIAINVIGLSVNTLCLQYVAASFYQVARSLILPFTVLLSWLVLKKTQTPAVLMACGVVFLGFVVGVWGEVELSWVGVAFGVASSVTTYVLFAFFRDQYFFLKTSSRRALHAVAIKHSLDIVKEDTMALVFYNNVLSAIALLPPVLLSRELPTLVGLWADHSASASSAISHMIVGTIVTGVFGFLINIAGFLQIQVTSPVTHMISSAVRGVLQTLIAVAIFNNVVTTANIVGIVLILAGSSLYTWAKSN